MIRPKKDLLRKSLATLVIGGMCAGILVGAGTGVANAGPGNGNGTVAVKFSPASALPGDTVQLIITATEIAPTPEDPHIPPNENNFTVVYRMEQLTFVKHSLPGQCASSVSPAAPKTPAGVIRCPTGYSGATRTDTFTFKVNSGATPGSADVSVTALYGRVAKIADPLSLKIGGVDCSKTLVVGLRGSGEPATAGEGMGNLVGAVFSNLAGRGKRVEAVDKKVLSTYPAAPVSDVVRNPKGYYDSVVKGKNLVLNEVRERIGNCGAARTKVALIGYSQGAMAVGDAIEQMNTAQRGMVKGVALFGDPRFTPFINGAGLALTVGIAGIRAPYPSGVGARTKSFCNPGDPICGFTHLGAPIPVGPRLLAVCLAAGENCSHMRYQTEVASAAAFLARQTGL